MPRVIPLGLTQIVIDVLIQKLGDEEQEIRDAAQKALIQMGPLPGFSLAIAAKFSPDAEIRRRAASILGKRLLVTDDLMIRYINVLYDWLPDPADTKTILNEIPLDGIISVKVRNRIRDILDEIG